MLENKHALLIGANGYIGSAIARALAAAGADVVLAARDEAQLTALRDAMITAGVSAESIRAMPLDVTDDDAVREVVAAAAADSGLDVAINNAGTGHQPTPMGELAIDELDRVLAVSLRGVAVAMIHQFAAMNDGGALVNIASTAGLNGVPGISTYVAAKHGVIGLTKSAALEYGDRGIWVNAVAPGPIESGKIMELGAPVRAQVGHSVALGRMGRADEVAEAAVWLASPRSSFTTGTVLVVDGGKRLA